jgi:predicted nucleotidyltransferase component of viral defense system
MTRRNPVNIVASVRQRLQNLSRERGLDFQQVLLTYAMERFLYRLGQSAHAKQFILKGAILFQLWTGTTFRPTRDLDLLGHGDSADDVLAQVFREICQTPVEEDGLVFLSETITAAPIREDQEYGGTRVQLLAKIGNARLSIQIDVGFGDVVTPVAQTVDYPTLLDYPAPHLRVYSRETVVAEKFQAMVHLGMANSRMKDFFDVDTLARQFAFTGKILHKAIGATFKRRKTPVPIDIPIALTDTFSADAAKQKQWKAFLRKTRLSVSDNDSLEHVIARLSNFLLPITQASPEQAAQMSWPTGGPWEEIKDGEPS